MDLLTDILQQAGLRRRLLNRRRFASSAALRFPCEKSFGLHVVTRGTVHLHAPALAGPVALHAGDLVLMARGCDHVVSGSPAVPTGELETARATLDHGSDAEDGDVAGEVVSGAYQLWHAPVHPLFGELPAWSVVRSEEVPRESPMAQTFALLAAEAAAPELGSETILYALLDASFTYLLREIVARRGDASVGWCAAVREPRVRQAVALLHEQSTRNWTLDELARAVGLSRTGLAEKFRLAMGDTPLSYLRTIRMQQAMRLLGETDDALEAVASAVGYQDAFSFSKVFKRTVGVAPRDFRRRDAAEREMPGRL